MALKSRIATAVLAATLAAGAAWPAWAQLQEQGYGYGHHGMWGGMWGGGGHGMWLGPLMMIIFVVLVVLVIVALVRWLRAPIHHAAAPSPGPVGRTALDVLKERFARGEIDAAEFEERRRVLGE